MSTPFKYYGGKKIESREIIELINSEREEILEESFEDIESVSDIKSSNIVCHFINHTEKITLSDFIKSGGEGKIYNTSKIGYVAKIYFSNKRNKTRESKIKLMVENPIHDSRIIWPCATIYYNNSFVGLLMKKSYGVVFEPDQGEEEHISSFFKNNKVNMLKVFDNVLSGLNVLKDNNIILGDFNFGSILINENTYDIEIVDLDGAQVDKYPCCVCQSGFNAPELFDCDFDIDDEECAIANTYYSSCYSTFDRDYYSVATYFFKFFITIFPLKSKRDLKNKDFKFSFDDEDISKNKVGDKYLAYWSHLPKFLKQTFTTCFTTENPNERPNFSKWKKLIQLYIKLLKEKTIQFYDDSCDNLYPNNFISYAVLNNFIFSEKIDYIVSGFSFKDCIRKFKNSLKTNNEVLSLDEGAISSILKEYSSYSINKNISFNILTNIGVYKKIKFVLTGPTI